MHSEETVLRPVLSNIVPISSHRKPRHQKIMEQMLRDIPEDKRYLYKNSDEDRVILAFDHMDQEQAQQFYVMVSERVCTRGRKLVRACLEDVLCYNSSLLPEIEEMAVRILKDGGSRRMANI